MLKVGLSNSQNSILIKNPIEGKHDKKIGQPGIPKNWPQSHLNNNYFILQK